MNSSLKLSIAVITMNRAEQLKEALESCLECALPPKTEFVIIDNASTDGTESTVNGIMESCGYEYYYEKLPENLGVGGGRNYAFSKARGEYVYVLDDDAVIDYETNPDFFIKAIEILDENEKIITLSTQIYDIVWERDRANASGRRIGENLYSCMMFLGGSHFLRKSFFSDSLPYLPNKYGYEEIPPSLVVMDSGKYNALAMDLRIIHKPRINKWDWNEEKNQILLVNGIALPYAIKKMMYPVIVLPLTWLVYKARCVIHLRKIKGSRKNAARIISDLLRNDPVKRRIKMSTYLSMVRDFKKSVL